MSEIQPLILLAGRENVTLHVQYNSHGGYVFPVAPIGAHTFLHRSIVRQGTGSHYRIYLYKPSQPPEPVQAERPCIRHIVDIALVQDLSD